MRRPAAREETHHAGLPCLAVGSGPPLVVLAGLAAEHRNPTGLDRRRQLRPLRRLAERCTIHRLTRRPGLPAGTNIADLAADAASTIRHDLGGPVPVMGISTGGSIALRLAIDHPEVVARLVLVSAAHRLSSRGRRMQRRLAELTEAGRPRDAWAAVGPGLARTRIGGRLMAAWLWSTGPLADPDDPSDMVATIRAEDAFDAGGELHLVAAPTLVVAGGRDGFYTPALFRATARGIPGARLVLYPGRGHGGVLTHPPAQRRIVGFLAAGTSVR